MKVPYVLTKARARERKARRLLQALWVLWVVILGANAALAYSIVTGGPSTGSDEWAGVARIDAARGSGTGFLVRPTYVVTAAHVVGGSGSSVTVVFPDGLVVEGTVVANGRDGAMGSPAAADLVDDWAIVELAQEVSPAWVVPLGESTILQTEDEVLAIGYPGGGPQNISKGILSGKEANVLRTDAGVDPGYSGGPLVSVAQRAVVGVIIATPVIAGRLAESNKIVIAIERIIEQSPVPIE